MIDIDDKSIREAVERWVLKCLDSDLTTTTIRSIKFGAEFEIDNYNPDTAQARPFILVDVGLRSPLSFPIDDVDIAELICEVLDS